VLVAWDGARRCGSCRWAHVAGARGAGARVTGARVTGARVTGARGGGARGGGARGARGRGAGARGACNRFTGAQIAGAHVTSARGARADASLVLVALGIVWLCSYRWGSCRFLLNSRWELGLVDGLLTKMKSQIIPQNKFLFKV
jgi:hypothetical protein